MERELKHRLASMAAAFAALAWLCFCQSAMAQAKSTFHTIDLIEFTRKPLSAYRSTETWSAPPRGLQTLADVPFKMDGKVDITGMESARISKFFPVEITGIPVGKKGQVLHLLHGTAYADAHGTPLARLVLNYAGGQRRSFVLVYGVHTAKWDLMGNDDRTKPKDTNSVVAWTGQAAARDLRLFKTAFVNPLPALEIKSIDLLSLFAEANPVFLAMTVEEKAREDTRPATGVLAASSEDNSAYRAEMVLRVFDASSGSAVAGAELHLDIGEGNSSYAFGTNKADSKGHIVFAYPPKRVSALYLQVTAPTHVGKRTELQKPAEGAFPAQQTVKLERGVEVGGLVQTRSGEPIAGATVTIYGIIRDEAGQSLLGRLGSAQTGARGRWTSRAVPQDFNDLQFSLAHPEFRPAEYESASSPAEGSVLKQALLAGKAVMLMQGGIHIEGQVLDSAGQAIPRAEVVLTQHLDDTPTNRTAQTDSAGRFKFVLMEEAGLHLVAQAKGYAPSFRRLTPTDGLTPIEFKLGKGKSLKGRVLDEEDQPISGASVRVDSWAEGPPLNWESQSDADGRFTWDALPEAALNVSVQAKGYVAISRREIPAVDEQSVLRLKKAFLVSGQVLDAETKQPIQEFSIIQGRYYSAGDVYWERHNLTQVRAPSGGYSVEDSQHDEGGRLQLLVEAPGYLPGISPPFANRGWHTRDFLLKQGEGPKGKVRLARGGAVSGAEVALVGAGTHVSLGKARLKNANKLNTTITDTGGSFSFPAMYATSVIALHEEGYAEATPEELAASGELVLHPWGALKGILILGGKPGTNESVLLAPNRSGRGLNYDWSNFKKDTGEEGRFEFSHVPPGQRFLVRLIPSDDQSWRWSNITPLDVKTGEVTIVTYGGTGRTVIGKVKPSDPERQINWRSGHHSLATPMPKPPKQFSTREEADTWNDSPEMTAALKNHRYYAVRLFDDGSFRIDEVPPGAYLLNLHFREEGGKSAGSIARDVEVGTGRPEEPVDLGTLELTISK